MIEPTLGMRSTHTANSSRDALISARRGPPRRRGRTPAEIEHPARVPPTQPSMLLAGIVVGILIAVAVLIYLHPPGGGTPASRTTQPTLSIKGWVAEVAGDALVVTNLHTGETYQLLPAENFLPPDDSKLIGPVYSPIRKELAYISIAADHTRALWVAPTSFAADGRRQLAPSGPRRLLANCGPHCNTLTWSPSGTWILYEGPTGLVALDRQTLEQRPVTHGAHDAWSACSPDGKWLAYQHDVDTEGYLMVVSSQDCLPVDTSAQVITFPDGHALGWHPAFSVDGRWLAFEASPAGTGTGALRIYMVG